MARKDDSASAGAFDDGIDFGATVRGRAKGDRVFDRFVLEKLLGRGGMGMVWLAQDERLERSVALKFLPELVALDARAVADLKRETRRSLDLTHPNIVRIYDFFSDSRMAAIAMEWVDGSTLSDLVIDRDEGHFSCEDLEPLVRQLCDALEYAHTKARVVHRDLKPANLMVNAIGYLKISDFGISATLSDSTARVSQAVSASGSPLYMSPQQMMGEQPSVTDDIYSLGATLYDLLTGRPPFYSGNIPMQVLHKVPPSITDRREELEVAGAPVPEHWERTLAACLSKEAVDRPQSMKQLATWLLEPGAAPVAVVAPPPVPEPVPEPAPAPAPEPEPEPEPKPEPKPVAEQPVEPAPEEPVAPAPAPEPEPQSEPVPAAEPSSSVAYPGAEPSTGSSKAPMIAVLVVVVAGLGAAGWWFGYEAPRRAAAAEAAEAARVAALRFPATLSSVPTGATVSLPGFESKVSPARYEALPVGRHAGVMTKPGYAPASFELEVTESGAVPQNPTVLHALQGSLALESGQDGVRFYLRSVDLTAADQDGVEREGTLPDSLSRLPVGAYEVSFERRGWEPKVAEVVIAASTTRTVTPPIFAEAEVQVQGGPAGQEFTVLDRNRQVVERSHSPVSFTLPPGEYLALATRSDFAEWEERFTVAEGGAASLTIAFPMATVAIESSPAGAEVWVEGQQVGTTPWRSAEVVPGAVSYSVRWRGQSKTVTGRASVDALLRLQAEFAPEPAETVSSVVEDDVPNTTVTASRTQRYESLAPSGGESSSSGSDAATGGSSRVIPAAELQARQTTTSAAKSTSVATHQQVVTRVPVSGVYPLNELSTPPRVLRQAAPEYPKNLRRDEVEGEVMIECIIDPTGFVRDIRVIRSTHAALADPAVEAVAKWRFTPGKIGNQAVNTRVRIPIAFSIEN